MRVFMYLCLLLPLSSLANTLTLCTGQSENFPYGGNAHKNGMFDDFIEIINKSHELTVSISRLPWRRCLRKVELGEHDGALALIYTDKRDSLFAYPKNKNNQLDRSKRVWTVNYPIFVHQDSQLNWDGQQFDKQDILLSAPAGFVAYEKLKALGVLSKSALTKQKGFELVSKKRLDGYVVEQSIGEMLLKAMTLSGKVKVLDKAFLSSDWYMVLSHQFVSAHLQHAQSFWRLLALAREEHGDRLYKLHMTPE